MLISEPLYTIFMHQLPLLCTSHTPSHAYNQRKYNIIMKFIPQNLYGYAMSQPVPIDEIKWVDERIVQSWTQHDIMRLESTSNASHSYILECDLEIPQNIHNETSDYPLCPEKLNINQDMISPKSWLVIDKIVYCVRCVSSMISYTMLCDNYIYCYKECFISTILILHIIFKVCEVCGMI